jgi:hypothetical protein
MKKNNYLLIAGVHKAGTTSLYTYLSWHPEVCASDIKETHFFSDDTYKKRYASYDLYFKTLSSNNKILLDASPEYFYGKQTTINRIKSSIQKPKLIFLLRDPVDKIVSSFNHQKKNLLFPKDYSFDNFFNDYLKNNLHLENIDSQSNAHELLEGNYIDFLPVWYDNFNDEDIKIVFFDELRDNPKKVTQDISKWLDIDSVFYNNKIFTVENKSIKVKHEYLQRLAIIISKKIEPVIRRNYRLKLFLRKCYYILNEGKSENDNLKIKSLKQLKDFYREKNLELKKILILKGYNNFPEWL